MSGPSDAAGRSGAEEAVHDDSGAEDELLQGIVEDMITGDVDNDETNASYPEATREEVHQRYATN